MIEIPNECIPEVNANSIKTSTKLEKIIELVNEIINRDEKVLIFSQWVGFMKIICNKLDQNNFKNVWIDGSCSQEKRKERINQFKDNLSIKCFLATYKVGGVGLNLTNANNVILTDMWWNPSVEDQATDRAHRIGQKKDVNIQKILVEDSIEDKILAMQNKKRNLRDNLID